jgi:adenylate kinase family enzyme
MPKFLPGINRICVIGVSGAGKSVFSRSLSGRTGLPVFHVDSFYWGENWTEIPAAVWRERVAGTLKLDRWILEGFMDENSAERLRHAELIIYLDLPGPLCAFNGIKRWLRHRRFRRPELAPGCAERFDPGFILKAMLMREERPAIEKALEGAGRLSLRRLKWPWQVSAFLKGTRI